MKLRLSSTSVLCMATLLLGAHPAAAGWGRKKKEEAPAPAEENKQTLAKLIEGAESFEGLVDLHRKDGKIYLAMPEDLIGQPLGFAAVRVAALGDFALAVA